MDVDIYHETILPIVLRMIFWDWFSAMWCFGFHFYRIMDIIVKNEMIIYSIIFLLANILWCASENLLWLTFSEIIRFTVRPIIGSLNRDQEMYIAL